jgi:hypothetical protein
MMKIASLTRVCAAAACIGIAGSLATPAIALADTASTAAIAAGIGAIVGTLIYDNNRHQYYYVDRGNRHYVNNDQAQQWYRHRDPGYYNTHQNDFRNNPGKFDRDWRSNHPHPH